MGGKGAHICMYVLGRGGRAQNTYELMSVSKYIFFVHILGISTVRKVLGLGFSKTFLKG